MAKSISINLYGEHDEVEVRVMAIDAGQRFVVLHLGPDFSIILDGFDGVAAKGARAIAAALIAAVADIPDAVESPATEDTAEESAVL